MLNLPVTTTKTINNVGTQTHKPSYGATFSCSGKPSLISNNDGETTNHRDRTPSAAGTHPQVAPR